MRQKVVIWGASGHALVVADILRLRGEYELAGFLDDVHIERQGEILCGLPILGGQEQLDAFLLQGIQHLIFGFGNGTKRLHLAGKVLAKGFNLATAIHPQSIVASDARIGRGTVIAAGAVVNPASRIGENVILNTCSSVDHGGVIGDGVHISPGAHLAGNVHVGEGAWIGIGATVIDGIHIGARAIIGAGAVVVRDIPEGVLAYGTPARVIRKSDEQN